MSDNIKKDEIKKEEVKREEVKRENVIKQDNKNTKSSLFEFSDKTSRKDTSTVDLLAQILKDKSADKEKGSK